MAKNAFLACAAMLPQACETLVKKTSFDLKGNVQAKIIENDQVDTGHMLNSVDVRDGENPYSKYVVVGAEYGIYQNYGTRYLPPRPFWEPSIDRTRSSFEAALRAIGRRIGEL